MPKNKVYKAEEKLKIVMEGISGTILEADLCNKKIISELQDSITGKNRLKTVHMRYLKAEGERDIIIR